MKYWFLLGSMALCLFSLWAIGRRDWVRLGTLSRRVEATVTGHRTLRDNSGISYAAIYAFDAEGARHEAIDEVYHARPQPDVGTRVALVFPVGRPDLARVPRPLMWLAVYGLLVVLVGMLAAKMLGWLG